MTKHRFRNRIKSIVGSLIDPDKDEELKSTNIETEDNYNKILELLKDENQDDKTKLTGLIEEFHTRYQSIYQRYDSITGKLKEKVRSKKEKEDSSSSSSSDSDNSSDRKESKNGKSENEIYMVADSLKVELEAANREIEELNRKLKVETEEKEAINLQCQVVLNKVQETENMFNDSKLQNSELLAEKTSLVSEMETAMATIEDEKRNNEELREVKDGFESELQGVKKKLEIYEEEKSNLIQKLEITEAENKSLLLKVSELTEEKEIHVSKIKDLESEIKTLEMKIKGTTEEIENGLRSKEQIVDELEEAIEDLKSDLEIKGDEVNTLTETVRNLEVKIRLSNQKLRITEQLLNETEHDHTTKEQKLHEQNKILMDKISTLSETIGFMKKEVQEKVNETLKGFDLLTVKFEEDYGHVITRVCEIRNEVKAVEIQARVNRSNNEYMKEKFEDTVAKLSDSLENAKGRNLEKDEKIQELEDVICVKDEEILCVCEDKRGAIRQLCVWGDYQRDRFDHLQELLKQPVDSRRLVR